LTTMQMDVTPGVLQMMSPNIELMIEIYKIYFQERFKEVNTLRLLRQAGITHESWMSRISCRLLASLGHQMVSLGNRLERLEINPTHQRLGNKEINEQNGFTLTRP